MSANGKMKFRKSRTKNPVTKVSSRTTALQNLSKDQILLLTNLFYHENTTVYKRDRAVYCTLRTIM